MIICDKFNVFISLKKSFLVVVLLAVIVLNVEANENFYFNDVKKTLLTNDAVIDTFNTAVFGPQHRQVLKRWEDGISPIIIVYGDYTSDHMRLIDEIIIVINQLANIDIKREISGDFNLFICITETPIYDSLIKYKEFLEAFLGSEDRVFEKIKQFEERRDVIEFDIISNKNTKQIVAGHVVSVFDFKKFTLRLGSGIMNLLGFIYFPYAEESFHKNITTSMSNAYLEQDISIGSVFTPLDELLIEMLYDDRLYSGITYLEAQPIITQMLTDSH